MIEVSVTPIYVQKTTEFFYKMKVSKPVVDVIYRACKKLLVELPLPEDDAVKIKDFLLFLMKIRQLMQKLGNTHYQGLDLQGAKDAIWVLRERLSLHIGLASKAPLYKGRKFKKRKLTDEFFQDENNYAIIYNQGVMQDMKDVHAMLQAAVNEVESKQQ